MDKVVHQQVYYAESRQFEPWDRSSSSRLSSGTRHAVPRTHLAQTPTVRCPSAPVGLPLALTPRIGDRSFRNTHRNRTGTQDSQQILQLEFGHWNTDRSHSTHRNMPNSNTYTEQQTNPSSRSRETAADRNVSNNSKTSSRKDVSFPGGIQAVEAVQRRAARVTLNDYRRTSSWNSLPGPVVMAPNVESFRAGLAACPP
ncbi:hypothetical protein Bbelb_140850 [Branchiostoma belcheri]|nr:hypothetical protein Bbelb_140850 [Branchiostoma belcheri]